MKLQALQAVYPSLHSSGIVLGTSFCSGIIPSLYKHPRLQDSWRITEAAVKRQLRAMVLTYCATIGKNLQSVCKTAHAITHFPQPGGLQLQTTCGLFAIYHISQEETACDAHDWQLRHLLHLPQVISPTFKQNVWSVLILSWWRK